jgi:hypothetical protein
MRWWNRVLERIARRHPEDDVRGHVAADRHLRRIRRQQPEVDELMNSLREERKANSFRRRMDQTFRGQTS